MMIVPAQIQLAKGLIGPHRPAAVFLRIADHDIDIAGEAAVDPGLGRRHARHRVEPLFGVSISIQLPVRVSAGDLAMVEM
jgi:hypothetical protein